MAFDCLQDLTPRDFFHWFGEILKIPHGSFKEGALVKYLIDFAEKRGFSWEKDEINNLLIRVPAARGYEDQPVFMFQAHLDMVWRSEVPFDFESLPIPLQVQGNKLTAKGTTLGADNAVGMATMLAIADGDYPHPALELLFTAAEEVGMEGIRAFDCSKLKARRMVNMDCGDSHVLCVTSAGSVTGQLEHTFEPQPVPAGWQVWKLRLSGGLGGHSGLCANKGRACGGNLLGDLLLGANIRLCSAKGEDAIMKASEAVIAAPGDIREQLQDRFGKLITVYKNTDPGWQLEITPDTAQSALNAQDSAHAVLVLSTLRTGQFRADGNLPEVIITSGQLREISLAEGKLYIDFAVRSACDADQALLFARYQAILATWGMELQLLRATSGWQEQPHSRLRQQFTAMHEKIFGYPMEIERVHGGVEVGIILGKLPDMDAVGIAPTARGAHTTNEHLFISEVAPYWSLMKAVLADKE